MRLVDDQDRGAAPFCLLGGQRVRGLRDQGGVVDQRLPAQRGDDLVMDAADPDRRIRQIDDRVTRRVQSGQGRADRDGLAGPTSPVITPMWRWATHQLIRETASP
jgi:hypothetical protein